MRVDVVTLFPELFPGPLTVGLVGRALREGRAEVGYVDPRRFTTDRHRSVDAAPYGGGAGMLMRPEPLTAAIDVVRERGPGPVVLLGPRGRRLGQADLARWARGAHLGLVCGRYEGFDERVRRRVDEEISLGDFVLTGGEPAALAIIDGVVRLLPGTLGNAASAPEDSFSDGLLEHPQYTRPERFEGHGVPDVLLGGHHGRVEAWRRARKLELTRERRPDLLAEVSLDLDDRTRLAALGPGRRAEVAVGLDAWRPEAVEALARLAAAWRLERAWLVGAGAERALAETPIFEVPGLLEALAAEAEAEVETRKRRRKARVGSVPVDPAALLRPIPSWAALAGAVDPALEVLTPGSGEPRVRPRDARALGRLLLAVGPGAAELPGARFVPPPRQGAALDALDPLLTAAVLLERTLGEG